jgi:hypothetical protein
MTHLMIVVYFTAQEGLLTLRIRRQTWAPAEKSTTSKRWVAIASEGLPAQLAILSPGISVKLMPVCNRQFRAVAMIACDSATTGMSDMTKLPQHIDEMGVLLTQTAKHEQSLVKALSDALSKIDEQLVQDIRKVAVQHQARRAEIYLELQALAHTIGVFPAAHEISHEIPHVPPANDVQPHFAAAVGDWRQAALNINYQDELDFHLNGTGP